MQIGKAKAGKKARKRGNVWKRLVGVCCCSFCFLCIAGAVIFVLFFSKTPTVTVTTMYASCQNIDDDCIATKGYTLRGTAVIENAGNSAYTINGTLTLHMENGDQIGQGNIINERIEAREQKTIFFWCEVDEIMLQTTDDLLLSPFEARSHVVRSSAKFQPTELGDEAPPSLYELRVAGAVSLWADGLPFSFTQTKVQAVPLEAFSQVAVVDYEA